MMGGWTGRSTTIERGHKKKKYMDDGMHEIQTINVVRLEKNQIVSLVSWPLTDEGKISAQNHFWFLAAKLAMRAGIDVDIDNKRLKKDKYHEFPNGVRLYIFGSTSSYDAK